MNVLQLLFPHCPCLTCGWSLPTLCSLCEGHILCLHPLLPWHSPFLDFFSLHCFILVLVGSLYRFLKTGSLYVAQTIIEMLSNPGRREPMILLPQPPKCCYYWGMPPYLEIPCLSDHFHYKLVFLFSSFWNPLVFSLSAVWDFPSGFLFPVLGTEALTWAH